MLDHDGLSWWPLIGAPMGGAGLMVPGGVTGMRAVVYGLQKESKTLFSTLWISWSIKM